MRTDDMGGEESAGTRSEQSSIAELLDGARPKDDRTWTIGELARECDVTLRALRFYEGKGLLDPERRGVVRTYDAEDRRRLRLIVRGKQIGLSLIEIRDLLDMPSRGRGMSGRWPRLREALNRQVTVLEEQKADIDRALANLAEEVAALDRREAQGREG
jgi:DNA-binding transcriptional MerR regulator